MPMAADQRRKRLNGSNLVGCSSREQYRAKKKKLESGHHDVDMSPCISLHWDDSQKRVVAKREQICITRRELSPLLNFVPHCQSILADVFSIPSEVFECANLTDLLSYEVWQHCLSAKERKLLGQFLPKGVDTQEVVRALCEGNNFHFGNPLLKWAASLFSGNLHPDAVLHKEQYYKTNKKAYYLELQNYHDDMIENLQKLKGMCDSCEDPENEFVSSIWRSRKQMVKNISTPATEVKLCNPEGSLGTTSESSSRIADEKVCSSDPHNSKMMKHRKDQKRKVLLKEKSQSQSLDTDDVPRGAARSRKGEKLTKRNIQNDGAKYMSYVMITKQQHQMLKSMKRSGKSIKSVLGDLDSFHVHPYENFEEEERKKLRNHWLQVATVDLPEGFANWRRTQSQRLQITKLLDVEIKGKLKYALEDEEGNFDAMHQESQSDTGIDHESTMKDDEDCVAASPENLTQLCELVDGGHSPYTSDVHLENNHVVLRSANAPVDRHEISSIDGVSEGNHISSNADDACPHVVENWTSLNPTNVSVSKGVSPPFAKDVWPSVDLPCSFYDSTPSHDFTSTRELSLGHPQAFENHQSQFIDLDSEMHRGPEENLLLRQPNDRTFTTYCHQSRTEIHPSFKDQGILSYKQEQNQLGSIFQQSANVLMGSGIMPVQFQEQLQQPHLFEQRQQRENDLYMHYQNVRENVYNTDRGRFFVPREEPLTPLNVRDWPGGPVCMPSSVLSHTNGGEVSNPKWLSGERRMQGGWSGSPNGACISSQSIRHESHTDEGLFRVLSQYNQMRSGTSCDLMGSSEQVIAPRNFGVMSSSIPRNSNILPHTAHPLDFLSGREQSRTPLNNSIGWVSAPHKNSGFDAMGEPFLRSWNQ